MKRLSISDLQLALTEEICRTHHNARISSFPDLSDLTTDVGESYADTIFWDYLSLEVEYLCDNLTEEIQEKYGLTLHFYSYGRMGATIAPYEWWENSNYNPGLSAEKMRIEPDPYHTYFDSNVEYYNHLRKTLAILKYINDYWRYHASRCVEWWEEEKKSIPRKYLLPSYDVPDSY